MDAGNYSDDSEVVAESPDENEEQDISEIGLKMARFVINAHSLGMVVKKADVVKHCFGGRRQLWLMCKQRAGHLITDTFGYALKTGQGEKDEYVFLVESSVEQRVPAEFLNDDQKLRQIFLFVILGYMTLKGTPVSEGQLTDFLKKLNIRADDAVFGDVQEILNQLANQQYLKRIKEDNTNSGEIS